MICTIAEKAVLAALELLYLPYLWGGNDPTVGLDCSGFVGWFLKGAGLLPTDYDDTAQGYYNRYKAHPLEKPQTGALAFFGKDVAHITHVMVCVSSRGCMGATGGNSTTVSIEIANQQRARVDVKPITYRSDLVAIVNPF